MSKLLDGIAQSRTTREAAMYLAASEASLDHAVLHGLEAARNEHRRLVQEYLRIWQGHIQQAGEHHNE